MSDSAYDPKRDILRVLTEVRKRVLAGDLQGLAIVGIGNVGCEGFVSAVGYADGGDEEWCDALDELREYVTSGESTEMPGEEDEGTDKMN